MATGSVTQTQDTPIHFLGRAALGAIGAVGNLSVFSFRMLVCLRNGLPRSSVLLPTMYRIGVLSVPVVMVTGAFIGMVLAVQSYSQFRQMHMENRMGAMIVLSLLTELGPVLAAVMLAGRVGSAMAAELGTMRVTEQIEALRALGADPLHHLVLPRFLACVLLIPLLTTIADSVGILGGWFFSVLVLGMDTFDFWHYALQMVVAYDVFIGLTKSVFFGAVIALMACHRGFHCGAGAEGVGRAATESFVASFIGILVIDFFLGVFLNDLYYFIYT
jgi:phospholipid/cholesterol/gamma-HCH transport system permease protein